MPARPRVLVTAFAPVPGVSPHGSALMSMLGALHADLDLVTLKTERSSHIERIGDARMFRVPVGEASRSARRETFERAVARQLEAERYDVVHVLGPFEGQLAADRKDELGFRLVYELATFPDDALDPREREAWRELHLRCVERADLVLVPTEVARASVAATSPAARVEVLPPGIAVDALDWRATPPHVPSRLLYLGDFASDRDLPAVLRALRRVRERTAIQALFAGEPDHHRHERLRALIDAYGLSDVVTLRGDVDPRTVPDLVAGADLCLAPAGASLRFDALGDLPQPLLEYMACRRPVIAGAVPGMAGILRDREEALLYPPGDDEALAESIEALLTAPEQASPMIETAYERVRRHHAMGARRRRVLELYASLLPELHALDPWAESPAEAELGPSASEIEAADAVLRADEPTGETEPTDLADEPTQSYVAPIDSPSLPPGALDTDPGQGSQEGLMEEATYPGT